MRWSVAIGVIVRCKRVSTVCAPKIRSRHALRSICGEKPKAKGVSRPCKPYMRRGQDEYNPVSLLQSPELAHLIRTRHLSPVELTNLYLERIGQYNGALKSYITVVPE